MLHFGQTISEYSIPLLWSLVIASRRLHLSKRRWNALIIQFPNCLHGARMTVWISSQGIEKKSQLFSTKTSNWQHCHEHRSIQHSMFTYLPWRIVFSERISSQSARCWIFNHSRELRVCVCSISRLPTDAATSAICTRPQKQKKNNDSELCVININFQRI